MRSQFLDNPELGDAEVNVIIRSGKLSLYLSEKQWQQHSPLLQNSRFGTCEWESYCKIEIL